MEMNYTMTLRDGTVLSHLGLNGTCYVSTTAFDPEMFTTENLSRIVVNDGESDMVLTNLVFTATRLMTDGYYYLMLHEMTTEERLLARISELEAALCEIDAEM